jgi:CRISPR/Cas system CSM-associated protein Csm3 (group 7 of RAMP superfamily)
MAGRFTSLGAVVTFELSLRADGPMLIKGPDAMSALRPDMAFIRYPTEHGDVPFLPGSSLKGVLRSGVEALLRAHGLRICDAVGENSCSRDGDRERCAACLMFGSTRGASVVLVDDGLPWPPNTPAEERRNYAHILEQRAVVRQSVGVNRRTGAAQRGALFDYEVLVDPAFYPTVRLRNPSALDVAAVAAGLQMLDDGLLRVGSGTTRGLGRMRLSSCTTTIVAPTIDAITSLGTLFNDRLPPPQRDRLLFHATLPEDPPPFKCLARRLRKLVEQHRR